MRHTMKHGLYKKMFRI